jgi:hypothetical protein
LLALFWAGTRGARTIPDHLLMILAGNVIVLLSLRGLIRATGLQNAAARALKRRPLKA